LAVRTLSDVSKIEIRCIEAVVCASEGNQYTENTIIQGELNLSLQAPSNARLLYVRATSTARLLYVSIRATSTASALSQRIEDVVGRSSFARGRVQRGKKRSTPGAGAGAILVLVEIQNIKYCN
jgi:hypothetical protein